MFIFVNFSMIKNIQNLIILFKSNTMFDSALDNTLFNHEMKIYIYFQLGLQNTVCHLIQQTSIFSKYIFNIQCNKKINRKVHMINEMKTKQ